MAAVAQVTARMRLGMLVTRSPRRRPWVVAREAATLDRLSKGRLVVGVGLGDDGWREFSSFRGEAVDPVQRAPILDDSLDLLRMFWSGNEVRWEGKHFAVESTSFLPQPAERPVTRLDGVPLAAPATTCQGRSPPGLFPVVRPRWVGHPGLSRSGGCVDARSELIAQGASTDIDIVCRGVSTLIEPRECSEGFASLEAVGMTGGSSPSVPVSLRWTSSRE